MLLLLISIIIKKFKILVPYNVRSFYEKYNIIIRNSDSNNWLFFLKKVINDKILINVIKTNDFSKNNELTERESNLINVEMFETNLKYANNFSIII